MLKKVWYLLKILFSICSMILGVICLYEAVVSFGEADPWGLSFTFYTLPLLFGTIIFFVLGITLIRELRYDKS